MTRNAWIIVTLAAAVVAVLAAVLLLQGRRTASGPGTGPQAATVAARPGADAAPDKGSAQADPPPRTKAAQDGPEAGRALVTGRPERVGECAMTTVERVGFRLEDGDGRPVPDSGSAIILANRVYGVSYDRIAAVDASRAGDPVLTCLVGLPQDCPPGDDRGRQYRSTNRRTGLSWTLPDAQHMCGGA